MSLKDFPISVSRNPLVNTLFEEKFDDQKIAPGNPKFILTEDGRFITTEDGRYLVTEN